MMLTLPNKLERSRCLIVSRVNLLDTVITRPQLDLVEVADVRNDRVFRRLIAERHWTKGQVAVSRKGNFHQRDVAVASLPTRRD
jgi:hypothetical protein